MPYLNLDLDYFNHPKVLRLIGLLGKGAEIYPIRLWIHCGKYHPEDGNLKGYSAAEIESIVDWTGEKDKLVEIFSHLNFLEKKDNGYRIHGWREHAGHLSVFKKRAKSAALKRWKSYATSIPTSNAKTDFTNTPYLTLPKDLKDLKDLISLPDLKSLSNLKSLPNQEMVENKTRNRANGSRSSRQPSSKQSEEEWLEDLKKNPAYIGIDIEVLRGRMIAWCDLNGKKPTRKRLLNWLNREDRPVEKKAKKTFLEIMAEKDLENQANMGEQGGS